MRRADIVKPMVAVDIFRIEAGKVASIGM